MYFYIIVSSGITDLPFIQGAMQSGMLKLAECRRLMYSIGNVLSVLPVNKTMEYLNILLAPSYEDLQKLAEAEQVSI